MTRSYPTRHPLSPNCPRCDAALVGIDAAPAVTVARPTSNPKLARQTTYCAPCAERIAR